MAATLDALLAADGLIVITPLRWNSIPGMLKGFIDKVMKEGEGLTRTVSARGVRGELGNLRRAYVLTTSTSPKAWIRFRNGNAIRLHPHEPDAPPAGGAALDVDSPRSGERRRGRTPGA